MWRYYLKRTKGGKFSMWTCIGALRHSLMPKKHQEGPRGVSVVVIMSFGTRSTGWDKHCTLEMKRHLTKLFISKLTSDLFLNVWWKDSGEGKWEGFELVRLENFNIEIWASKCTSLWKGCFIFQLGFKYIIAEESGLASESAALPAPKPMQCRKGRTVIQLFSSYVRINHWLSWLLFSIELPSSSCTLASPRFACCLTNLSLVPLSMPHQGRPPSTQASCQLPPVFPTWQINTYLSCMGGSCIQLLNRGSYRLTKFVLCFPVKYKKLRFILLLFSTFNSVL